MLRFSSVHVKTRCWPRTKLQIATRQDRQTGTYPRGSVLSPRQLSSDTARLVLDMPPAVRLAVTTVITRLEPKRAKNTFKFEKIVSHPRASASKDNKGNYFAYRAKLQHRIYVTTFFFHFFVLLIIRFLAYIFNNEVTGRSHSAANLRKRIRGWKAGSDHVASVKITSLPSLGADTADAEVILPFPVNPEQLNALGF